MPRPLASSQVNALDAVVRCSHNPSVAGSNPARPTEKHAGQVAAEELGDLGLQRGLHQQLRAEPGNVFQDLWQRFALSEQLVDVARIRSVGDNRCGMGVGPSLR
jgi:hypothetical protein